MIQSNNSRSKEVWSVKSVGFYPIQMTENSKGNRHRETDGDVNNLIYNSSRSCTDVICGFIFAIFLVAWGFLGFFGKFA